MKWIVKSAGLGRGVAEAGLAGFIFQLKISATSVSFCLLVSCFSKLYTRFASASAYRLLRNESFVAATIITAMGNESSSISMLRVWSVTTALSIASSILFLALSMIRLYSGLSSSVIFRSRSCTYWAAWGVKGYLARSVFVRTRLCPSAEGVSRAS